MENFLTATLFEHKLMQSSKDDGSTMMSSYLSSSKSFVFKNLTLFPGSHEGIDDWDGGGGGGKGEALFA